MTVRVVREAAGHRLAGAGPITEVGNRFLAHLQGRGFAAGTVRVDVDDQPALLVQPARMQLSQPLGGSGDELARHRRLRRALRRLGARLIDWLEARRVAAGGQPGKHRADHVLGERTPRPRPAAG